MLPTIRTLLCLLSAPALGQAADCPTRCLTLSETPTALSAAIIDADGTVLASELAPQPHATPASAPLLVELSAPALQRRAAQGRSAKTSAHAPDEALRLPGGGWLAIVHHGSASIYIALQPDASIHSMQIVLDRPH